MKLDLRLVLAIDYPTMGLIVSNFLRELGYVNVIAARTLDNAGAQGVLPVLRGSRAELLILDWELQQTSALAVLKQIRADFKLAKLPVLMLLADARREHLVEAIQAGATAYLVKPFDASALQQQLDRIQQSFAGSGR